MRGLLIKTPWIDAILEGRKTWEICGSNTRVRGTIALIRSGSGHIAGTCELWDVKGPLTLAQMRKNVRKHRIPPADLARGLPYAKTYAWVIGNAKALKKPIPYKHPPGAIIWAITNLPYQRGMLYLTGRAKS